MVKYIKDKQGRFAGSIGDGRDNTPTPPPSVTAHTADEQHTFTLPSLETSSNRVPTETVTDPDELRRIGDSKPDDYTLGALLNNPHTPEDVFIRYANEIYQGRNGVDYRDALSNPACPKTVADAMSNDRAIARPALQDLYLSTNRADALIAANPHSDPNHLEDIARLNEERRPELAARAIRNPSFRKDDLDYFAFSEGVVGRAVFLKSVKGLNSAA